MTGTQRPEAGGRAAAPVVPPDGKRLPLTPDLVGLQLGPYDVSWDVDDVILYALGIGAGPEHELDLLYERRGPVVFPTFATIPGMRFVEPLMATVDANWSASVHGAQRVELVRETIPPAASARTTARVVDLWDKQSAAVFVVEGTTADDDGALFRVRATLFVPGSGGFGGDRGPSGLGELETPPGEPDIEVVRHTRPEQAALYRLSGDRNPLHVDPEVARQLGFDRPILHGLCTYGFAARGMVAGVCADDPTRLRAFEGRFTKPMYPGGSALVRIWKGSADVARFEVRDDDGDLVFANGLAELSATASR